MAKRFTDTDIWDKEWFMSLSCKHKCLVRFLFDKCDASGVWHPNWTLASAYIGEKITEADMVVLDRLLERLPNGYYFIPDFIQFQYGMLSENCKPHTKIILLLKKHDLYERVYKGYTKGIHTLEEEEEDKEDNMDIDTDVEKGGTGGKEKPPTWKTDFQLYLSELRTAYKTLIADHEFLETQQRFLPNVDIPLTLEKACTNYWATEAGWKHKKKQRTSTIDWKATLTNALSQSQNKVYKNGFAKTNTTIIPTDASGFRTSPIDAL